MLWTQVITGFEVNELTNWLRRLVQARSRSLGDCGMAN